MTLQFDPHLVHDQFSLTHNFNARLQKTSDEAALDIPLQSYKLNWPITCDLSESGTFLSGAFFFVGYISTVKYNL